MLITYFIFLLLGHLKIFKGEILRLFFFISQASKIWHRIKLFINSDKWSHSRGILKEVIDPITVIFWGFKFSMPFINGIWILQMEKSEICMKVCFRNARVEWIPYERPHWVSSSWCRQQHYCSKMVTFLIQSIILVFARMRFIPVFSW